MFLKQAMVCDFLHKDDHLIRENKPWSISNGYN